MDWMGQSIVDTITQYLSQRLDVQGLVHQTFTGEHREHELVQTHAFLPHVHAPDNLGAQLQVLVQLLPLELQLRHGMADVHTIDKRCTAAPQGTRVR
jgi:hypothetical protein